MRKTKEEAELTRRAILQSALDTFYEKGYSKTTFDEIAKRINLTKGAVYWHFRNKPDVIAALINVYFETMKDELEQKMPQFCNLEDILNYFLHNADLILNNQYCRKFAFFLCCQMEWSEAIITKVSPQIEQNKQYWFNRIKETLTFMQNSGDISDEINSDDLAHIFMNTWAGALDAYLSRRCAVDLKKMIKESFNLIFNGLRKERTENAGK